MIRFALVLLACAALLAFGGWYAHAHGHVEKLPSFFYETLIFLVFSTAIIFFYLYTQNKPDFFLQLYLLTMVVKFIAYGAYIFVVIQEDKPGAVLNVMFFMCVYFGFTALEIGFLYRRITSGGKR